MKKLLSILLIAILSISSISIAQKPIKKLVCEPWTMKVGNKTFKGTDCFYINK